MDISSISIYQQGYKSLERRSLECACSKLSLISVLKPCLEQDIESIDRFQRKASRFHFVTSKYKNDMSLNDSASLILVEKMHGYTQSEHRKVVKL